LPPHSIQGRAEADPNSLFPDATLSPFAFLSINLAGLKDNGIPPWSYYPRVRDGILRTISKQEPIMAGALYTFTSRIKSLRWNINGGRNSKKYYQRVFAEADGGRGFGEFISKVVTDLETQDNGAFIELVGAGREDKPLVGRVTEIWHLDSAQCWRTFDPEFPVIYQNPRDNTFKRLHKTRVIMLSNNPQPDERGRSIGYCAVSRALRMMQTMRNIQTFKDEKVSGRFKRGLIYGNGLTDKTFDQAMSRSEQISENKGFTVYNEIPVLLTMLPDMKLQMLDLASLPDGFDWEKEVNLYVYILALCFATDAREFWPATASGATKADATVQHMKAQGKGIGDIIKSIETAFNWQIMPSNGECEFEYDYTDDEQDKLKAELDGLVAANIALFQANGWIDPFEGRALAIHHGLFDPAALVTVEYPDLADDSGPVNDTLDAEPIVADVQTEPAAAGAVNTFDTTGGAKASAIPFKENLHERDNSGRFGSGGGGSSGGSGGGKKPGGNGATGSGPSQGGGSDTSASGDNATLPGLEQPKLTPLADRLKSFLNILNQRGKFDGNQLTIVQQARDRSADLQMYLRHKGFPNATVTAERKGKGWVYTINPGDGSAAPGKKPKKPRKPRKPSTTPKKPRKPRKLKRTTDVQFKAVSNDPADRVAVYEEDLAALVQGFIDDVGDGVTGDELQELLDNLEDDYIELMRTELTAAFGIGLAGAKPTKAGIARLKEIGQTSADYFRDNFIPDLEAAADNWYAANSTGEKGLDSFLSRIRLYAGSFWESIWHGIGDRIPSDGKKALKVQRVLDPAASHCPTCPPKAKIYDSYNAMVDEAGVPGDGSDDCKTNCRCKLKVETRPGSGIFEELIGTPTVFVTPLFEVIP
jgi:uncharacterized membrane protein YgcG